MLFELGRCVVITAVWISLFSMNVGSVVLLLSEAGNRPRLKDTANGVLNSGILLGILCMAFVLVAL